MLVFLIRLSRLIPGRLRRTCPRAGASCSELGLAAARAGLGIAGVLAVLSTCSVTPGPIPGQPCLMFEDCLSCPDPPGFCVTALVLRKFR